MVLRQENPRSQSPNAEVTGAEPHEAAIAAVIAGFVRCFFSMFRLLDVGSLNLELHAKCDGVGILTLGAAGIRVATGCVEVQLEVVSGNNVVDTQFRE